MRKSGFAVAIILACVVLLAATQIAQAQLKRASGKVTMLRVHDVGSKYGPAGDQLDVEVIFKLDTLPKMAFGFQLPNDNQMAARQGMLDLLRDAFNHGWKVHTDYSVGDVEFPRSNCKVFRIWITKK